MHELKHECRTSLDIRLVLNKVSQLFVDQPKLLLEFTYFLHDELQEEVREQMRVVMKKEIQNK